MAMPPFASRLIAISYAGMKMFSRLPGGENSKGLSFPPRENLTLLQKDEKRVKVGKIVI
jgi:hypothetical protein